jgi:hypothetical protein
MGSFADRHADHGQRKQRPATHRVDVRERVGGGDAAKVECVVYNRHEEVGCRHHRLRVVQLVHGGVVARLGADEQLWCDHCAETARFREQVTQNSRCNLASASATMRQLSQTNRLLFGRRSHFSLRNDFVNLLLVIVNNNQCSTTTTTTTTKTTSIFRR